MLVTLAHLDVGEVIDHDVGTTCQESIGIAGALHTDDDCEPAVMARLDPCLGILDDDGPARIRGQSARYFEEHGGLGLPSRASPPAITPST